MKLLLGATIALLMGALAVSWQGMKTGVQNTPPDEFARLQKQIKELRFEQDNLKMQRDLQVLRSTPIETSANPSAELAAVKLQVAENKRALEEIEQQKNAARDQKVDQDEAGLLGQRNLESKDSALRRARMISDALLVGRVKEYVEDSQMGSFVTFEVVMPDLIKPGFIVSIRRKTGVLGQLKIAEISAEGAIANPLPGFGPVKPQIGDELILLPLD